MSFSLVLTLLVSIVLHVGLVLFGPAVPLSPVRAGQPDAMEVALVRREVPIPEALRPKPLPEVPLPEPLDLSGLLWGKTAAERSLNLAVKPEFKMSGPAALPESRPLPEPPAVDLPAPALAPGAAAIAEPPEASGGLGEIALSMGAPAESKGLMEGRSRAPLLDDGADRKMLAELSRASRTRRGAVIGGPAARRRIVFRPKPPRPEGLEDTTEIILKFWVLPDGTVGRVVPIRKASAYLEGLAAKNLKRWRFSPLQPGAGAGEQWGAITFRFLLR